MWFLILWLHLQFEVFHSHFTHVVSRGRYIALRVGDTDKALYAVILKRGGNLTVRTSLLVVFKVLPLPLVWVAWTWKIFQRSKKDHILWYSRLKFKAIYSLVLMILSYCFAFMLYLKNDWILNLLHRIVVLIKKQKKVYINILNLA